MRTQYLSYSELSKFCFRFCNVCAQVALLAACVKKGLKVLSATGAGARVDPTRIRIADLKESSNDPLSRSVSLCPRLRETRREKWSDLFVLTF